MVQNIVMYVCTSDRESRTFATTPCAALHPRADPISYAISYDKCAERRADLLAELPKVDLSVEGEVLGRYINLATHSSGEGPLSSLSCSSLATADQFPDSAISDSSMTPSISAVHSPSHSSSPLSDATFSPIGKWFV